MVAADWSSHGSGSPVTLVVPGLAATEGEARIPASGLRGTRVVVTLPGHGSASEPPADYWSYVRVAGDVLAVADEVGATRAVGVSLGAGALTRIVAEHPERFERLALLLPAALDRPRESPEAFQRLANAVDQDDGELLRRLVAEGIPPGTDVGDYVERRATALRRVGAALRALPEQRPLEDSAVLAAAQAEVLVVGADDDPLHPARIAKDTAAAFPRSRLEILPSAAPMLTHRRDLRALLTGFFG